MGVRLGRLEIIESKAGEALIVSLKGQFDAEAASHFQPLLLAALDRGERKILLDVSGLDHFAGPGLRVLLAVAKRLEKCGQRLAVSDLTGSVAHLLKTTQLDALVDVYADQESAYVLASARNCSGRQTGSWL